MIKPYLQHIVARFLLDLPASFCYPLIRFQLDIAASPGPNDDWQQVRVSEQQIVDLELSLSELARHSQFATTSSQLDESAEAHYNSLQTAYTAQLKQACVLRKLAFTRLYRNPFTVSESTLELGSILRKVS